MRGRAGGRGRERCGVRPRGIFRSLLASFFVLMLCFAASPRVLAEAAGAEAGARLEPLDIVTASGSHPFLVEVMRTEAERERGLMFRRSLPEDHGMLFDFQTARLVQMWMRNTFIPLDMIFISRSGAVVGLVENAEPLSERIISSGAPADGVIEVNAGIAAKIGVRIGDRIRHPLFSK